MADFAVSILVFKYRVFNESAKVAKKGLKCLVFNYNYKKLN